MCGIDPADIKPGNVITKSWDEDPSKDSCHCSFQVDISEEESAEKSPGSVIARVVVISHGLKEGDVVRDIFERGDDGHCHCDYYFLVDRNFMTK